MTMLLEFHDSEIRCVETHDDRLTVYFTAAHVVQQGSPAGNTEGFVRTLEMTIAGAHWQASLAACLGRLSAGRVIVDGVVQLRLALPSTLLGDVKTELQFANGTLLAVSGAGLMCRFAGEPGFVADLRC